MRTLPHLHRVVIALLVVAAFLAIISGVQAQRSDPIVTTAHTEAIIYAGPGDTYEPMGDLNPAVEVTIIERNRIGNWLHITGEEIDGTPIDGWVMIGYLNIPPELRFSTLPVNTTLPDADIENVEDEALAQLYAAPVIPTVDPTLQILYERGQIMGNNSQVVTKVGDSVSADPLYLSLMSNEERELGPYDYLEDTLDYFGPNVETWSLAARMGLTSFGVLDPMFAESDECEPNESSLACEYRIRKPSISFIMMGANDVHYTEVDEFDMSMRMIVEETIDAGVIPVLSTFTYDPNYPMWDEAIEFNLDLVEIAADYKIPIINLWSAARALPNYGLDGDPVHMRHSGWRYLKFDTGHESWFGVSLRNLLSIRMLDELRRTLNMD